MFPWKREFWKNEKATHVGGRNSKTGGENINLFFKTIDYFSFSDLSTFSCIFLTMSTHFLINEKFMFPFTMVFMF